MKTVFDVITMLMVISNVVYIIENKSGYAISILKFETHVLHDIFAIIWLDQEASDFTFWYSDPEHIREANSVLIIPTYT